MPPLPIEDVLPELKRVLRSNTSAVLQAPPGAGKTTLVPLALQDEPWMGGRRLVMLEPRRLAARAAAHRMAKLLGERVGETVGYRVRMDTKVGPRTRIEVVTEGVLTRFLQEDPSLEGIGAVVFDEFHERSLQSDLGLALCLESKAAFRDDLRMLVMSATIEGQRVASLLDGAPVIVSEGRSFPVETHYLEHTPQGPVEGSVVSAARQALADHDGSILVFLPGAGEIRRVHERLEGSGLGPEVLIAQLYGSMPLAAQDVAIDPPPPGRRKVVLATSIAETSLTIEGIRVVVDSGLVREPRFSSESGMTRLETVPVSQASADQRRGRAGRLGPGVCYRLWTRFAHQHLAPHSTPEILQADLAPLALELAVWGAHDPNALAWLDAPPEDAFAQARELLHDLGALDESGAVTPHGRRMAELALHPRLAHMILVAQDFGLAGTACDLGALLGERDIFKGEGGLPDADVRLRLHALEEIRGGSRQVSLHATGFRIDYGAARRVLEVADHWRRQLRISSQDRDVEAAGLLVALAYPDRIAQQRPGQPGRFRLRNGRNAYFISPQLLEEAPYASMASLDGDRRESLVFLAAPLALEEIERHFRGEIEEVTAVEWDREAQAVRARRQRRLGALVLKETPLTDADPNRIASVLVEGVRQEGLHVLPWSTESQRLRERMQFVHHLDPAWPDVSDEALLATMPEWLLPHVFGMRSLADVQRLDMYQVLTGLLTWPQQAELDDLAPSHVAVPSGSRIPVDYSKPEAPVLAVRLQEVFGLVETPRVARGRVPLTLHLLSPARRPVQVTQDLASFWQNTYFDVRKDLRGRYPKHYWPEDPLEAEATSRTKPRR